MDIKESAELMELMRIAIQESIKPIEVRLDNIEKEIVEIKSDVKEVKEEVKKINGRVTELETHRFWDIVHKDWALKLLLLASGIGIGFLMDHFIKL